MAKLRITYSKSTIGYSKDQKATVRSLGLGKLNSVVIRDDTPATRGMVFKVRHLVTVEEVADNTPAKTPKRTVRPVVTQPLAESAPAKTTKRATRSAATQKLVEEGQAPATTEDSAKPAATQKLTDEPVVPAADEPVATQELAVEPPTPTEEPGATQQLSDEPAAPAVDDLEVIEGIGPKIAGVLRDAGINSFAELAAADSERLAEILQEANLRLASSETWAEQAELAATGDWEGLKQLQERLKGGRRE
jgi:large subunit ribosomal protein L30